jgi:hypothetical protein
MAVMERLSALTADLDQKLSGVVVARWLSSLYACEGRREFALDFYRKTFDFRTTHFNVLESFVTKAATLPGSTTDPAWAGALIPPTLINLGFQPLVTAASAVARAPLRRVPFLVSVPRQTGLGSFAFVGEGKPKPMTTLQFADVRLFPLKASGMVAVTEELLRLSAPGTEQLLLLALAGGLALFVDSLFLDPTNAGVANVQPPSITHGVAPITATGNLSADVGALIAAFFAAFPTANAPILFASPGTIAKIAGSGVHPDLNATTGGVLFGIPVYPTVGAGANLVLADAASVTYAAGPAALDTSTAGSVEFESAPVAPTAGTVFASLWQSNLVALRVETTVNWDGGHAQFLPVP